MNNSFDNVSCEEFYTSENDWTDYDNYLQQLEEAEADYNNHLQQLEEAEAVRKATNRHYDQLWIDEKANRAFMESR
jgi:hypothetical protein